MPPTANNVQITISVVDAGSAAAINNVRTEIVGLDAEAAKLAQSWGVAGTQIERGNNSLRETAGASGAAEAGLNRVKNAAGLVRYAFAEMGIHVPRYLASELAGIQALTGALTAFSGVFFAMGIASIFESGIKSAKKFYDEEVSVTHAMDEYIQKAGEGAQKHLFDTASIETTSAALTDINRQLNEIERQRTVNLNVNNTGNAGADVFNAPSHGVEKNLNDQRAALLPLRDLAYNKTLDQQDEQRKKQIESDRKYFDATHEGYARIKKDKEYAIQLADVELSLTRRKEQEQRDIALNQRNQQIAQGVPAEKLLYVPPVDARGGETAHTLALQDADREAKAAERTQGKTDFDQRKQWAEEELRMRNEAAQAGLRGEALYARQVQDQEDAIRLKIQQNEEALSRGFATTTGYRKQALREIADLETKYAAESLKRRQDAEVETGKLQLQAAGAGLTGAAKIEHEGELKQYDLGMQLLKGAMTPEEYFKRAAAAEHETAAEMTKDQQDFFTRVDELADSSAGHQISGFARIRAEQQKELDSLYRAFEEHTRGLDQSSPEFEQYANAYTRGAASISGAAGTQSAELTRKNSDETLKLEEEANRKSLRGETQKTQQIVDEYKDRVRKYDEMLRATEISQEDHDRRIVAAAKERDAALQQQAEETRDKLAGELSGLFKNPSQWMKGIGEKAMSQAAASMLMRVPGMERAAGGKGGLMGSLEDGSWIGDFFQHGQQQNTAQHGGIFSRLLHPGAAGASMTGALAPHVTGAASAMSVATATIHVGSATISLGGAGLIGASGPKGALPAGLPGAEGIASTALSTSTPGYTTPDSPASAGAAGTQAIATAAGAGGDGANALGKVSAGFGYGQDMLQLAKQFGIKLPHSKQVPNASSADTQESGDAGAGANLAGVASGGMGLVGAAMGDGGFGGAMGGAMSGAQLGSFAGPIGTAIGAAGGFLLGMMGFGGRAKAKEYFEKQVRPHLAQTEQQFNTGQMDYLTAFADLQSLDIEAYKSTRGFGPGGHGYYSGTIKPAIVGEENKITGEAKAGRAKYTMAAAQFHSGGWIGGFGDLATSDDEGFIHARRHEVVIEPMQAQRNAPIISAIHSGLDLPKLLQGPSRMPVQHSSQMSITVQAIDSRGVAQFLDSYKHHIRAAVNGSYESYAGGSDL